MKTGEGDNYLGEAYNTMQDEFQAPGAWNQPSC